MNKQLAFVGSGIKSLCHLTVEAQTYIKQAECVLYLVNEPIIEQWLQTYSKKCISLEPTYFLYSQRKDAYSKIAAEIVAYFKDYHFITVVIYGHPTIFATPVLKAIELAEKADIEVKVLPGISADACLFADLAIDPSQNGYCSVEASNLLRFNDPINKFCDLLIWQLGMIGNSSPFKQIGFGEYLERIQNKLLDVYAVDHLVILYEASLYPGIPSKINRFSLIDLCQKSISTIATLYIPAVNRGQVFL